MISPRTSVTLLMMIIASTFASGVLAALLDAVSPIRPRRLRTIEPNSNALLMDCLCVSEYNETYFRNIPKIPCATGYDVRDVVEYLLPIMPLTFQITDSEVLLDSKVPDGVQRLYSPYLRTSLRKYIPRWTPEFTFPVKGTSIYFTQCSPKKPIGLLLPVNQRVDMNKMPDEGLYNVNVLD